MSDPMISNWEIVARSVLIELLNAAIKREEYEGELTREWELEALRDQVKAGRGGILDRARWESIELPTEDHR